jgi:arginine exporter protein ArgO
MSNITASLTSVLLAIVGVALVSAIVSKNANTSAIIQTSGNAFGNSLLAALSPVTGQMPTLSNL